jgi:hypothetical protein
MFGSFNTPLLLLSDFSDDDGDEIKDILSINLMRYSMDNQAGT